MRSVKTQQIQNETDSSTQLCCATAVATDGPIAQIELTTSMSNGALHAYIVNAARQVLTGWLDPLSKTIWIGPNNLHHSLPPKPGLHMHSAADEMTPPAGGCVPGGH
jgi:hypothetical protein